MAALGSAGVLAAAAAVVLMAVSHPAVALGHRLALREIDPEELIMVSSAELSSRKQRGSPWHAGTQRLHCRPSCPELRVGWPKLQHARFVSLSVDHNDRYRVFFYRGGDRLGALDVVGNRHSSGLRVVRTAVPEKARAGFDAIGVLPLSGDGRYAVGHVIAEP